MQMIDKDHQLGNGRIETEFVQVLADFFYRLVEEDFGFLAFLMVVSDLWAQIAISSNNLSPGFIKKTVNAPNPF